MKRLLGRGLLLLSIFISTLLSFTFRYPAYASIIQYDTSFGGSGVVTSDIASDDAHAITMFNGKIFVAGDSDNVVTVWSYNQDGSVNTSFGTAGVKTLGSGYASKIHAQSNGRIIVIAESGGSPSNVSVYVFNEVGVMDTTFSGDGFASIGYAGGNDIPNEFVVDGSGNIIICGDAQVSVYTFALWKLLPDGTLDTTFNGTGSYYNSYPTWNYCDAIAITATGKYLTAGGYNAGNYALRIMQFNTDGTLDTSFGSGGTVIYAPPGHQDIKDLQLLSDGSFLVTGSDYSGSYAPVVRKFLSNGTIDSTFGTAGTIYISPYVGTFGYDSLLVNDEIAVLSTTLNASTVVPRVGYYGTQGSLLFNHMQTSCAYQSWYAGLYNDSNQYVYATATCQNASRDVGVWRYKLQYQISGLSLLTATVADVDISTATGNGVFGQQVVRVSKTAIPLGEISVTFTKDRDWSSVTGDSNIGDAKSFLHGATSLVGSASSFSLYVPKSPTSNAVMVCPGAQNLAEVTLSCAGGITYQVGNANLSIQNIASQDYWVIANVTGTGGMSYLVVPPTPTPSPSTAAPYVYASQPSPSVSVTVTPTPTPTVSITPTMMPTEVVDSNVIVTVVLSDGNPLMNTEVKIGNDTYKTDDKGRFTIKAPRNGSYSLSAVVDGQQVATSFTLGISDTQKIVTLEKNSKKNSWVWLYILAFIVLLGAIVWSQFNKQQN